MFPCNSPQQESNNPQGKIQVPTLDKTSNYLCRKRENKQASDSKKKKKRKTFSHSRTILNPSISLSYSFVAF